VPAKKYLPYIAIAVIIIGIFMPFAGAFFLLAIYFLVLKNKRKKIKGE